MPNSVLEAIKLGIWDFEPDACEQEEYESTQALPGSAEKLAVLSARVQKGQPLWHPSDRRTYDDTESRPR